MGEVSKNEGENKLCQGKQEMNSMREVEKGQRKVREERREERIGER